MNTIDLVILVVVLIGLVRGVMTGGIRQILSFGGIFLAFIIIARALFKTKTFIVNIKRKIYVLMKIKGYGKSQFPTTHYVA